MKRTRKNWNWLDGEILVRRNRLGVITYDTQDKIYVVRAASRHGVGFGGAASLPQAHKLLRLLDPGVEP
jgi:hypothetical protein